MNPNEIKKALECRVNFNSNECSECPYRIGKYLCDVETFAKDTLAYINQLEAEVERLKQQELILIQKRANIFEITSAFERGRKSGINEFAERVDEEISLALESNYKARQERLDNTISLIKDEMLNYINGKIDCLKGLEDFVYNLVKEMVGENNEQN